MYSDQEIDDLKAKLTHFSNNYVAAIVRRINISTTTVNRFFNKKSTRPITADKIYDAGLAFIEQQEREMKIRTDKARKLIYGDDVPEDRIGKDAVQGRLDFNAHR